MGIENLNRAPDNLDHELNLSSHPSLTFTTLPDASESFKQDSHTRHGIDPIAVCRDICDFEW